MDRDAEAPKSERAYPLAPALQAWAARRGLPSPKNEMPSR